MDLRTPAQTLAVGAIGAAIAYALHVPAPFLVGPAALVTAAAFGGVRVDIPGALRNVAFVVVGLGMGSGVTPEVLEAAARWPLSLVGLVVAVAAILWGGGYLLRYALRVDRRTALLAAAPGHLSFVLSLGLDVRADLPLLTLIQSLRVLALTILTPPLAVWLSGAPLPRGLTPMEPMPLLQLIPLALVAAATGWAMMRLRVPAGMLLGAMFTSAVAHGSGLTHGGVPPWAAIPGLVILGSLIGGRFTGVSASLLPRALMGAVLLTGLAVALACLGAVITSEIVGYPLTTVLIAYAPGGVETMVAMSMMLHADPAYVALHHVVRIFSLTFLIPLALGRR